MLISIGYESIQYAGRHDNRLTRIISAPGAYIQHITTREPDDGMIQCAIESMMRVVPGAEGHAERETLSAPPWTPKPSADRAVRPRRRAGRGTPGREGKGDGFRARKALKRFFRETV